MKTTCFHCELDIPENLDYHYDVLGKRQAFCCAGCLAIAETLVENNLTDFYRFRSNASNKPEELIPQEIQDLEALDNLSVLEEISEQQQNFHSIELGLEGITCAACGWLIEKKLSALPQVEKISVNVSTQRATLLWSKDFPLSDILKSLVKLGYRAYPFSEDARQKSFEQSNRSYIKRLLVAGLGMMQVMTYALAIYIGEFQDISAEHQLFLYWISAIVATPVVFYSAKPFFQSAWRNIKARRLGMNLPVSIAILSAYTASVYSLIFDRSIYYFDSVVMFTFFLLIGRYLEHRARYRSLLKQQNFQRLMPLSATKRHSDQSLSSITISEIQPDDILIINAGGMIPVDGILLENNAEIDESILTGEFMPVNKQLGDLLASGSSNYSASLSMQVTQDFAHSKIQSLINLQHNAEQMKPDSVSLADKIAHWYVFGLLVLVCVAGIYWWRIDPEQVFPIILSVLVVSCPCALSLATPAVIAAATSQLSDMGLMIRTKTALSKLAKISRVYFDKTGTLTTGLMHITEVIPLTELTKESCLQIASQLENISNHPIASAFKKYKTVNMKSENLQETIGQGVSGTIDGQKYQLGNKVFVEKFLPAANQLLSCDEMTDKQFETHLFLVSGKKHLATFILQDSLKNSAKQAIAKLKQLALPVTLLSGDSGSAVANAARQLNISEYIYNATPQKKLDVIDSAQQQTDRCLMIGDGFNDVGALAAASVSITMATGTNVSKAASDAVLISNDLTVIPESLKLAKKIERIIKQNISWAVAYNLIAIPFAMAGLVPAWLAAIGMSFSSLVVVLNALRLRS